MTEAHTLRRSSYERVFDIPTQAGRNDGNFWSSKVAWLLTPGFDRLVIQIAENRSPFVSAAKPSLRSTAISITRMAG
jgi:hypothetical protein